LRWRILINCDRRLTLKGGQIRDNNNGGKRFEIVVELNVRVGN